MSTARHSAATPIANSPTPVNGPPIVLATIFMAASAAACIVEPGECRASECLAIYLNAIGWPSRSQPLGPSARMLRRLEFFERWLLAASATDNNGAELVSRSSTIQAATCSSSHTATWLRRTCPRM